MQPIKVVSSFLLHLRPLHPKDLVRIPLILFHPDLWVAPLQSVLPAVPCSQPITKQPQAHPSAPQPAEIPLQSPRITKGRKPSTSTLSMRALVIAMYFFCTRSCSKRRSSQATPLQFQHHRHHWLIGAGQFLPNGGHLFGGY